MYFTQTLNHVLFFEAFLFWLSGRLSFCWTKVIHARIQWHFLSHLFCWSACLLLLLRCCLSLLLMSSVPTREASQDKDKKKNISDVTSRRKRDRHLRMKWRRKRPREGRRSQSISVRVIVHQSSLVSSWSPFLLIPLHCRREKNMRDQKHERGRQKVYVYHEVFLFFMKLPETKGKKIVVETKKDCYICSPSSFQFPRLFKWTRRRWRAKKTLRFKRKPDQFFTILSKRQ